MKKTAQLSTINSEFVAVRRREASLSRTGIIR